MSTRLARDCSRTTTSTCITNAVRRRAPCSAALLVGMTLAAFTRLPGSIAFVALHGKPALAAGRTQHGCGGMLLTGRPRHSTLGGVTRCMYTARGALERPLSVGAVAGRMGEVVLKMSAGDLGEGGGGGEHASGERERYRSPLGGSHQAKITTWGPVRGDGMIHDTAAVATGAVEYV